MEKRKLKLNDMCWHYLVKSRTETLVGHTEIGREVVRKTRTLPLRLIGSLLIALFAITGCSDVPYTGPTLTVDYVDRYLDSIGEDTVCLQDGFDTVCLKLLPADGGTEDDTPIVHVHPTSVSYVFYYKDEPILHAEREMDTTQIVQELIDTGRIQHPPNSGNQGADGNTAGNWTIQIYYPDVFPEAKRGQTPETSGLDIRVVEGMKIGANKRKDFVIKNFTQVDGPNGSRGVRFSVETDASEITIQVNDLVPYHTAIFHINADDVASGEGSNTLELKPL